MPAQKLAESDDVHETDVLPGMTALRTIPGTTAEVGPGGGGLGSVSICLAPCATPTEPNDKH